MGIAYSYLSSPIKKTLLKKGHKKRFSKNSDEHVSINLGSFWQLENLLENFP